MTKKAKMKKRITKTYVVEFYLEIDAPDEGDETPFIVEQHVRKFLEQEMQRLEFGRVKFGKIDTVGAQESHDD